jgi:glycosyltransferase involved in cell wall biosynthesis
MGVTPYRIVDVKNAVDTASFDPDRPLQYPDRLQAFADDHDGAFIVGYVGGLYQYKGTADIPPILRQTSEDVRAVVVGDGPQRDRLVEALGDRGTILGALAYDAMPAFYDTVDALLLPSYSEGLPRTILEAQAMETPVVATRVGGIPELVEDGSTGLLADPGDVDGLAQAIDRLKSKPSLAKRLGRAGREQVLGRWTWEHLFDRYEMALEELLA